MPAAEATPVIPFEVHEKFLPLLNTPHTYADIRGGRYGMKTETVHRCAIRRAMLEPLRVIGARETLESTRDSSIKTIADIIHGHQMATSQNGPFEVLKDTIRRRDGEQIVSEFNFIGVRENIRDKKSLANVDLMIFDEAGKCSADTLNVFLPTVIRKPGCKAWFCWNPENTTDPIYQFFDDPPRGTIRIETSYKDNPWLSEESLNLILHTQQHDPELYEHLYLGKPLSDVKGGIFEAEMKAAREAKPSRLCNIPYNPNKPVHTCWDLGDDTTAIWFIQAYGGHLNFIDYLEDAGKNLDHYLILLQCRGYIYGTDYLPHDQAQGWTHRKFMATPNPAATVAGIMRGLGRKVHVCAGNLNTISIEHARRNFAICRFDEVKCEDGIRGISHYQWDRELTDDGHRKPRHNWASHPTSAFMNATISVKESTPAPKVDHEERFDRGVEFGWG